jgi:hypothetical protein
MTFTNKCFLFTVGSVCRVKRFTTVSRNSLKDVRKSQTMPDQARKWLRQQSKKDFYAAGLDRLVKRKDKCINDGRGHFEKEMFSSSFEYHMFSVLHPFVTYLLTLPRIYIFL